MVPLPVTLIFDIGKTTKKVLLFDAAFQVVEEQTITFSLQHDDDGFAMEDLFAVSAWLAEQVYYFCHHPAWKVEAVNVSAYGASLVHLDASSCTLLPFYNYLKMLPQTILEKFLATYDAHGDLNAQTASPVMGLLNSGLQLYWLKHMRTDFFNRVAWSLHLPQYFAFLIHKKKLADVTSVGCHTLLWDFAQQRYHRWVTLENLERLLPPLHAADYAVPHPDRSMKVGIGVHDSSAALMPYLVSRHAPFLLLSTGTWNICFNPYNNSPLTSDEMRHDCLCYLTYDGKPVKASRIFLGNEHDEQVRALSEHFQCDATEVTSLDFDEACYQNLTLSDNAARAVFPISMEGTGPLPSKVAGKTDFGAFDTRLEAYHQVIRYLVRWQLLSVDLVDPDGEVKDIIVVGGFARNEIFLETLKRESQPRCVYISDHPRAAALGAAWLVQGEARYRAATELLKVVPV